MGNLYSYARKDLNAECIAITFEDEHRKTEVILTCARELRYGVRHTGKKVVLNRLVTSSYRAMKIIPLI